MKTLIAVALLLLLPASARAQEVEVSKEHYRRAVKLVELGKHQEAIREFELAYEANPRPNLLYNIAHEHGVLAEAGAVDEMRRSLEFYQRYLAVQSSGANRPEVEGHIVDLKARIESAEAAAREMKVQSPVEPAPAPAKMDERVVLAPPSPPRLRSARLRPWQWVLIGAGSVVVVGTAVGLGVGLSQRNSAPDSTLGGWGISWQ